MKWQLPNNNQFPYKNIMTLISDNIQSGNLLFGQKLPSERELSQKLNVDRSTVRHALSELTSADILIRKKGSGTFINKYSLQHHEISIHWLDYLKGNRLGTINSYFDKLEQLKNVNAYIDLYSANLLPNMAPNIKVPEITWQKIISLQSEIDDSGYIDLKKNLVQKLKIYLNQEIPLNQVLITSGTQQSIFLLVLSLLNSGDTVLVEQPSYYYSLPLFKMAEINLQGIPLKENGKLDIDRIQQLYFKYKPRFIFINPSFQNPTGSLMSLEDRKKLVILCQNLQLPIIEDDPFGLMNIESNPPIYPLKCLDKNNVIYIGSLSAIAGKNIRIGWLISPAKLVTQLANARNHIDMGLSIIPQISASKLISDKNFDNYLKQLHNQLSSNKQKTIKLLMPLENKKLLKIHKNDNYFYLWISLNIPENLSLTDYNIFIKNGLLILPDIIFGINNNHIKINLVHISDANRTKIIKKIEHACIFLTQKYYKKTISMPIEFK